MASRRDVGKVGNVEEAGEKAPLLQRSWDTVTSHSYTKEQSKQKDGIVVSTEVDAVRLRRHITLPYAVGTSLDYI